MRCRYSSAVLCVAYQLALATYPNDLGGSSRRNIACNGHGRRVRYKQPADRTSTAADYNGSALLRRTPVSALCCEEEGPNAIGTLRNLRPTLLWANRTKGSSVIDSRTFFPPPPLLPRSPDMLTDRRSSLNHPAARKPATGSEREPLFSTGFSRSLTASRATQLYT